jgi:hypothetical protein
MFAGLSRAASCAQRVTAELLSLLLIFPNLLIPEPSCIKEFSSLR